MVVLYLQKPAVLDAQRAVVEAALADVPDLELRFASSPREARRHAEAEVVIAPTLPWLPDALAGLPAVRWIHFLSAGVDKIWAMPFDASAYTLSKSSGVHAATISEFVLGAVLYVLKGFGVFARQQAERRWARFWLDECAGKTLAIVGAGRIGTALATRARALGMRVVGTVHTPRDIPELDAVYGPDALHEALAEADFVVLLVPLTEATRGLVGRDALAAMKPTAWLINVARGAVVDEAALVEALRAETIGGAVLDVFEHEPLPAESPLWDLENVLLTPHVAGTTQHYIPRALEVFRRNLERYVDGRPLVTPVSPERGY